MVGNKIVAAIRSDGKVYSVNNSSGVGDGGVGANSVISISNNVLHQNHGHFPVKIRANSGGSVYNMSDNSDIVVNNNRLQASVMDMGKKLLQCARDNDVIGVESLIAKGSPFASDWLGMTAIHFAAMNDGYEICKLLTNTGINKDARTKVDRTPLHLAAFYGHERIVKLLIDSQCALNPRDMLRMTPLHWAVEKRHKGIVRLLIKHNADVTAISKFGKTPIALAVLTEQPDILQELETARQMQQNRKYNEQHEKETNEAVNSIMGITNDYEPAEKRFRLNSESDKSSKSIRKDSEPILEDKDITVADNPAVNLLKSHGISIMNDDEDTSNNLLTTALQNGRQLVLSEGGKLLLNEAKKMNKTPFSDAVKLVSNQPSISAPMGLMKVANKTTTKQIETKFRPNIINKSKPGIMTTTTTAAATTAPTPKDVTGKNIRIISLNDFKKIYGNGNLKTMPSTINKSQVVKIKAQKPQVQQIKEEQPDFIEYEYDPQYDDEETDLPPNIIKVSAESDQDDFSDFENIQTATIHPPATPMPEQPMQSISSAQINNNNSVRYSYTTKSPNKAPTTTLPDRTPVIPLLTIPEICRQLLELRKQNDELRRKYEIAQKEKEDFRNRLERLESLLIEEQTMEEIADM